MTGRRVRILLAMLLLEVGKPVPADRLIDAIWGDAPPASARNQIQVAVFQLRKRLAHAGAPTPILLTGRDGYHAQIQPSQLDLGGFRAEVSTARHATAAGAVAIARDTYRTALAHWRGPAFAGIDSPPVRQVAAALDDERLHAHEECLRLDLALGAGGELVTELTELVTTHPYRERLHAALMQALYRAGRQADALAAYRQVRRLLHNELGTDPGAELQQLHRAILSGDPTLTIAGVPLLPGQPASGGPPADTSVGTGRAEQLRRLKPASAGSLSGGAGQSGPRRQAFQRPAPAQLPPDVAAFTGRDHELRRLDAFLRDGATDATAMVIAAIEGTAGVGKTALALHWGHRVRDRFPDGQLYVNLRGYASESPLPPIEALSRFLRALGVPDGRVPEDLDEAAAMFRSLAADKRMLMLLDNAASPMQVRPLLPGGPGSMVLVTSRDRLDGLVASDGARRLGVDVLAPAEAHALLTRLLGAGRTGPGPYAVGEVARLCGYLPLALRIAAAHLTARPHCPITDYAAQLSERDRLANLTLPGDLRRTVQAAFDLSYFRLTVSAQRMFRLLGLVPGPDVAAEAASALAGTSLEEAVRLMEVLAGAHLVEGHRPGRYACHDLLRCYASDRLGRDETDSARDAARVRLYDHYLRHTDAAARLLYPSLVRLPQPAQQGSGAPAADLGDAASARRWLDAERENLAAAIQRAHPDLHSHVWQLADGLRGYFWLRTPASWRPTATAGLVAAEAAGDLRAQAAGNLSLALFHQRRGNLHEAVARASRARELAGVTGWVNGEAAALNALGSASLRAGDLNQARQCFTAALAHAEQAGERVLVVAVLGTLAVVDAQAGRLAQAAGRARRALTLSHALGSRNSQAANLCNLGEIDRFRGRLGPAIDQLAESRAIYRAVGNTTGQSQSLCNLAAAHRDAGRHPEALAKASAALALAREAGDQQCEAECLATLASVHLCLGRPQEAADLCANAIAVARRNTDRYNEAQALIVLAAECRLLEEYGAGRGHAAEALDIARGSGFRVIEGQALTVLAGLHLAMGETDRGRELGGRALTIHQQTGNRIDAAHTHLVLGQASQQGADLDAARHRREAHQTHSTGRRL